MTKNDIAVLRVIWTRPAAAWQGLDAGRCRSVAQADPSLHQGAEEGRPRCRGDRRSRTRPIMTFVIKSEEQLDLQVLHWERERLVAASDREAGCLGGVTKRRHPARWSIDHYGHV